MEVPLYPQYLNCTNSKLLMVASGNFVCVFVLTVWFIGVFLLTISNAIGLTSSLSD